MALMTRVQLLKTVRRLEVLGLGFPRTPDGVDALADAVQLMTGNEADRVVWLVHQAIMGCPRCPTPIELRRIYEKKFPPADGIGSNSIDQSDFMSVDKSKS